MKIGNKEVGDDHPCFIVCEIGINHNGDVEIAKKLIDAAALAGADAVKFQKRTVEIVYSAEELAKPRESPFGKTNGDLKRGLEFGYAEYQQINRYCFDKGIMWFASPWDIQSVSFLENFDPPVYKVASACVTDIELLHNIGTTGKPIIVSTGMSSLQEIDRCVKVLSQYSDDIALLACTSTYPAKLEELNLNRIHTLKKLYPQYVVGWSNHFPGLWMTLAAMAMGASIVEAHITLSRSMYGSDQAASIEPQGIMRLVSEIRDFEIARGDGKIGPIESEKPIMEKLRRF